MALLEYCFVGGMIAYECDCYHLLPLILWLKVSFSCDSIAKNHLPFVSYFLALKSPIYTSLRIDRIPFYPIAAQSESQFASSAINKCAPCVDRSFSILSNCCTEQITKIDETVSVLFASRAIQRCNTHRTYSVLFIDIGFGGNEGD